MKKVLLNGLPNNREEGKPNPIKCIKNRMKRLLDAKNKETKMEKRKWTRLVVSTGLLMGSWAAWAEHDDENAIVATAQDVADDAKQKEAELPADLEDRVFLSKEGHEVRFYYDNKNILRADVKEKLTNIKHEGLIVKIDNEKKVNLTPEYLLQKQHMHVFFPKESEVFDGEGIVYIGNIGLKGGVGYSSLSGGTGGSSFNDSNSSITRIRNIIVKHGKFVDSIRAEYLVGNRSYWSPKHGGSGGSETIITLSNNEIVLRVYGKSGKYVDSIGFIIYNRKTGKSRRLGPYGGNGGSSFSFSQDGRGILSFYGRSGRYLDAIGGNW